MCKSPQKIFSKPNVATSKKDMCLDQMRFTMGMQSWFDK